VSHQTPLPPFDLEALMREALSEAELAGRAGELPIGAVVALDGQIVGRGRARQNERRTQLAHAELAALLDAGEAILTRHDEAVVVTTVEPCPLCLGACVMADVPHIVYGLRDPSTAIPEAVTDLPYIRRHIATYQGGLLAAESRALFVRYRSDALRYFPEPAS
jgi:tRNA(Arg) A34 adenosine deaminase TadA